MEFLRDSEPSGLIAGGLVALGLHVGAQRAQAQSPTPILDAVRLELMTVDDSAAYHVYRYRVMNPASSHGGVGGVRVDLSAPLGTERINLPSTGDLERNGSGGELGHVPVGLIGPERWRMTVLPYNAHAYWYAADYGVVVNGFGLPASADSASAGGSKDGFGLRSPYLPGIRSFMAQPTFQSCCTEPNARGEYPLPTEFPVRGFTVAPTVRPPDMNLDILSHDVQQTCGALRWISDGAICGRLRAGLERASAALKRSDHASAKDTLRAFLAEVEQQHGRGKPVNDNAYWLLKVNAEYLLAHM